MNFVQVHIQATSDIQEDAAGPVNGGFFQQGTGNCLVGGLDGTIVTMRHTGPHDSHTHARHDRLHVGKVQIDQAGRRDQVGDALDRLP